MLKKTLLITLISLLLFTTFPFATLMAKNDVKGHYFEKDLTTLIDNGLLTGFEDGSYRPDSPLTRAELTAMLVRMLDLKQQSSTMTFKDVKKGSWYEPYIQNAASNNLINGFEDQTFRPNEAITREQMSAMLSRTLQHLSIQSFQQSLLFKDKSKINSIYIKEIESLVFLGIVAHKEGIDFRPKDKVTRGEASAFLNRTQNIIDNPKIITSNVSYNTTFDAMVKTQMSLPKSWAPRADGSARFRASQKNVSYYANPSNFEKGTTEFLQFLDLSQVINISAAEINKTFLTNTGALSNQGQQFVEAGKLYGVNAIYLLAHALHETGNGSSVLSQGVPLDKNGKVMRDSDGNLVDHSLASKVVYNFFGYGARDTDPVNLGAAKALEEKWFTPKAAIWGGVKLIAENWIHHPTYQQNTLYKMRWNPNKPGTHQYATHTRWAVLQTNIMASDSFKKTLNQYTLTYELPQYSNQPSKTTKPTGAALYLVDKTFPVSKGTVTASSLNVRRIPGSLSASNLIGVLPKALEVTINGDNGGWVNVTASNVSGWVSGEYLEFTVPDKKLSGALGAVNTNSLNLRKGPSTEFTSLNKLDKGSNVILEGQAGDWYKVLAKVDNKQVSGWVSKSYIDIKVRAQSRSAETEQENLEQAPTPILAVTNDSLLLYDESTDVINEIPSETSVTVLEISDTEILISYQDNIGWVDKNHLTIYNEG
jgi:beta-N-acetylglucosaminidase/uncharacterized protein YraI